MTIRALILGSKDSEIPIVALVVIFVRQGDENRLDASLQLILDVRKVKQCG